MLDGALNIILPLWYINLNVSAAMLDVYLNRPTSAVQLAVYLNISVAC